MISKWAEDLMSVSCKKVRPPDKIDPTPGQNRK